MKNLKERYNTHKKLNQAIKGIPERYKNPKVNIAETSELFVALIYLAYEENDFHINNQVLHSNRITMNVLNNKLKNVRQNSDDAFDIEFAIFKIQSTMNTFYKKALRNWD